MSVITNCDFPQIHGGQQIIFGFNLWASPNLWEIILTSKMIHDHALDWPSSPEPHPLCASVLSVVDPKTARFHHRGQHVWLPVRDHASGTWQVPRLVLEASL